MNESQAIDLLKRIVAEDLDLNLDYTQIDDTASLFEDGLALDSISLTEFIHHIERRFQIRILDEDLQTETFLSLDSVAALVLKRRSDRACEVGA